MNTLLTLNFLSGKIYVGTTH